MPNKAVLAIGVDPAFADPSALRGLKPELVRAYVEAEIEGLRKLGYDVVSRLVDPGGGAEEDVETALRSRRFDCVLIGAGLRKPEQLLLLFERVINLVHELAPNVRIAFNSRPSDSAEAVRRWIEP